jgi:hypothetical protein
MTGGSWPGARAQQAPDFCGQHPFVTRLGTKRIADAALRLSKSVKGCGVEIAQPASPSGAHDGFRSLSIHGDPVTTY